MGILQLENLHYSYQDGNKRREILKGASYNFEQGKVYMIFGPSGSGKTTLISLAGGLEKKQSGNILFKGEAVTDKALSQYRRNSLAFVFQQFNLIPYLTAEENVLNVMNITGNELPKPYEKTALNLLNMVGIGASKAKRSVLKLSGGEQQRVAIARSLATNADLIFADEPTGNLDQETEKEIIKIFKKLAYAFNKCVIIVTHSWRIADDCDVRLELENGQLIERK